MSNHLPSKLGEGLSKIQGGFEQGKQKLQVVQEITKLKRSINELSVEKSKVLLRLGQLTYYKLRSGELADTELQELSSSIMALDRESYQISKKITELSNSNPDQLICNHCGTSNGLNDKFCGGCGKKIEIKMDIDQTTASDCMACGQLVPDEANYCPCCGIRKNY